MTRGPHAASERADEQASRTAPNRIRFRGVLVRKSGKYAKESGRRDRHTPVGAAWSLESEVAFFTAENLSNSYLDDLDATR